MKNLLSGFAKYVCKIFDFYDEAPRFPDLLKCTKFRTISNIYDEHLRCLIGS